MKVDGDLQHTVALKLPWRASMKSMAGEEREGSGFTGKVQ